MRKTRKKNKESNSVQPSNDNFNSVSMSEEANRLYYRYGVAVNEDRAIPGELDGLKPVARRCLWATHVMGVHSTSKVMKSAAFVGKVIAEYHPHGDLSAYMTYVTLVNSPIPMVQGEGNWGSFSDSSVAAYRYTNMRLSAYSDRIFFDRFYLPAVTQIPNYDDSKTEPLVLPALLPNLLINGNFGIGVGARTDIPSFKLKSVAKVLIESLKSKHGADDKLCQKLEFTSLYEGEPIPNKQEFKQIFSKGKGKVQFKSVYETVDKHTVDFIKFAPFSTLEKVLDKIANIKDVANVNDVSDVKDKHGRIRITFKKSLKPQEIYKLADKIAVSELGAARSYDIAVTDRFVDEKGLGAAKLKSTNVVSIINNWISFRIDLEKTACTYWIDKRQSEINYLKLMRLAVKNRRFIIQALDKKYNDEQLANYIAKGLKITVEQANTILDLKIRQLKALEDQVLVDKIKKLEKEITEYRQRIAKPKAYIARNIIDITKELLK